MIRAIAGARIATLGLVLALGACTPAELAKTDADFEAGCQDWQSVKGLAGEGGSFLPSPGNQLAAITISLVGDACDSEDFKAKAGPEQAEWIRNSTANLKAIVAAPGG